jgi:nitrite reductase/ring-hydroxylating ferredoxin subunit
MARHVVAQVDEIPPGSRKLVVVDRREIGVYNVGGEFFALRNRCPHQGGPLCDGRVLRHVESSAPGDYRFGDSHLIACPWHGWEFDLRTGQSWFDPARTRVRPYPVAVESGETLAKGPYVAETYPVTIEHDYVTIEL